ncbi:hypothetical protein [Butyrivibrio sp. YAB3001]|uniref:hypothetical protein n=1 Tax=Butyrivibrio sp. YAB3001 TaxID=1520812 RepID=UPI0008F66575|nr:hypothetical protein [Butyrivibrio sp. YAB3001]SFD01337.1 hypothetical protein SAMN02910398_03778 [Butyrivibrio sp. YAB3001]
MAKNIKEVDEISTTDKLKAFKTLKDAGFKVEFNGSGVPTVVCPRLEDMDKELKNVKKILKDLRYTGSFGIRGPRKTDNVLAENEQENNLTPEIEEVLTA